MFECFLSFSSSSTNFICGLLFAEQVFCKVCSVKIWGKTKSFLWVANTTSSLRFPEQRPEECQLILSSLHILVEFERRIAILKRDQETLDINWVFPFIFSFSNFKNLLNLFSSLFYNLTFRKTNKQGRNCRTVGE